MKLSISLAASRVHVLDVKGKLIITLDGPIAVRPVKKTIENTYKDIPYVLVDPYFVWDKGYPEEKVCPTVEMISVPKKQQGNGIGRKLFEAILLIMRQYNLPVVRFDDYSAGFWQSLNSPHVSFPKKFRGKIGHITL